MLFLWIKAAHIIAVIAWMAGMLYLPRLFVYHAGLPPGSIVQAETFKLMERRLLKAIMLPAMAVTWLLGAVLAYQSAAYLSGWFYAKLVLVIAMSGLHGWFSRLVRDFANDRNARSSKFYRVANEVPTVIMIAIVILVVVKPGG